VKKDKFMMRSFAIRKFNFNDAKKVVNFLSCLLFFFCWCWFM